MANRGGDPQRSCTGWDDADRIAIAGVAQEYPGMPGFEVVIRTTSDEERRILINNRQNGRRGRGRNNNNGLRPMGGGNQDRGNRIDNRARGNASQLHEKYKTLARDAQMQGDRVMTEYYHQFADHYFRVLAETRGRFEEQRPRRDPQDDFDGDEADGVEATAGGDDRYDDQPRGQQRDHARQPDGAPRDARGDGQGGDPREPRAEREPRPRRDRDGQRDQYRDQPRDGHRDDRPVAADPVAAAPAPLAAEPVAEAEAPRRPRGRPRRDARAVEAAADAPRIDSDRLPPSFLSESIAPAAAPPAADVAEGEEAPRRRRVRRPRADEAGAVPAEA